MTTLRGIAAAPGVAMGKIFKIGGESLLVPRYAIHESDVDQELKRLDDALSQTREQILAIQRRLEDDLGQEHAEIFSAHLLILEDQSVKQEIAYGLRSEQLNIEAVFDDVIRRHLRAFSRTNDEYLRERTADIDDVRKRVLRNLMGKSHETLANFKEPVIVLSHDLSPSETAQMHKKNVLAFITEVGGRTSHTAIMAKSLEIPAVVGLVGACEHIKKGDFVIIDGSRGEVILSPDAKTIELYEGAQRRNDELSRQLLELKDQPAQTKDGHIVNLLANIELPEEVSSVIAHGAAGIGLFRTEFLYLNRADFPTEEEQFEAYRTVLEQMGPKPVIIRTMDLGGDKFLSPVGLPSEMNPFMGWRAIRFSLARPDIFRIQLRALLRASVYGNLKIMYPLISGVEELIRANEILNEVKEELKRENVAVTEDFEIGAMIEVPSAALTCDLLAEHVDFFSIGTNDLIQYSLAVDRVNEKIAYLYEPTHPAILRLIKHVVEISRKSNLWVGMCGEMAGEPAMTLLLIGMGISELSTSPVQLPFIKRIIRSIDFRFAQEVVEKAMTLKTTKEVEAYLLATLRQVAPELVDD
jgi:phosphotransferase system enzyme I (PtsI)